MTILYPILLVFSDFDQVLVKFHAKNVFFRRSLRHDIFKTNSRMAILVFVGRSFGDRHCLDNAFRNFSPALPTQQFCIQGNFNLFFMYLKFDRNNNIFKFFELNRISSKHVLLKSDYRTVNIQACFFVFLFDTRNKADKT